MMMMMMHMVLFSSPIGQVPVRAGPCRFEYPRSKWVHTHQPGDELWLFQGAQRQQDTDPNIDNLDGMNSAACRDLTTLKVLLAHGGDCGIQQRGVHSEGWRPLDREDQEAFQGSTASKCFKGQLTTCEWAAN